MIGMFTDVFNATSAWALMSVLLREKLKERVKVCKRLLLVADKLRALGNFHSLFAIVSALGLTPIARMRHTMDELIAQKKIAALQSELTAVTLFKGNYAAYRRELRAHAAPKVPYLGVITSDYTLAEEGNTDRTPDGLVNYAKCRLLANLLRNVRLMQQTRYAFHELPEILTPLESARCPLCRLACLTPLQISPLPTRRCRTRSLPTSSPSPAPRRRAPPCSTCATPRSPRRPLSRCAPLPLLRATPRS